MMIPANEWWAILQNYNEVVFPVQIIFYLMAIGILVLFYKQPGQISSQIVKGYFVLTFGWIGIVFFLTMGHELPAYKAQAFLFISLALLFAADLVTNTSQFRIPKTRWQRIATTIGFGLVLIYPLVGIMQGHNPSKWIIPGTFPCPTTALALVFMATTLPTKRRWLYLVTLGLLTLWAIPFPIMIQIPKFGVYEDAIMLVIGIYSLIMLIINWKTEKSTGLPDDSIHSFSTQ